MKSFIIMFHFYFLLASMVVAIPPPEEIPWDDLIDWGEPIGYITH